MSDPQDPQPPYASSQPAGYPASQPGGYPASQPGGYPASNGYPQQAYPAPAAPKGTLGRTAFILALIGAGLGMLFLAMTPFLIGGLHEIQMFHIFSTIRSVLVFVLSVTALILGLIAARRGDQPVLAGIAIGIGGLEVVSTVVVVGSNLVSSLL